MSSSWSLPSARTLERRVSFLSLDFGCREVASVTMDLYIKKSLEWLLKSKLYPAALSLGSPSLSLTPTPRKRQSIRQFTTLLTERSSSAPSRS